VSMCAACGNGLQYNKLEVVECETLKELMGKHENNLVLVSRELKLSVSTLKRKLLKHGLRERGVPLPGRRGGHPCRHTVVNGERVEPS